MAVACQNKNCPYYENNECMRRVTIINKFGLCSFIFKGQQLRQLHDKDWKYIKKGDMAVFDDEKNQTDSEDFINETAVHNE